MSEKTELVEEKVDNKLAAGEIDDVNSEVVPSVDSDKNSSDLNLPANLSKFSNVQKRKRPRRKSKKGKYPYSKSAWLQRREQGNSERAQRVRQQMFAHGQPVAPYNTTQFLIEDHGDLQKIDAQLQVAQDQMPGSSILNNKPSRARDSSFSIDSDDDFFYSSPEDEEEFLTKEFSTAYEDLHVERLSSMSKSDIIHDYLQLEAKYEKSVIELRRLKRGGGEEAAMPENEDHEQEAEEHDRDTDTSSKSENEIAEQLRISQLENKSLKVELEELRKENKTLRSLMEKNQSSSVDSESDSSSTSSMSSDTSSSGSESDEEMKSTNNDLRTSESNEINMQTNFSNLNGVTQNGNVSDEDDDHKNCEAEK